MARHPSDVRRTPVDITRRVLKDIFESIFGVHHIASTGMHYPFGLACRTRGIEDVQDVFAVHFFCLAYILLVNYFIMPPGVSPLLHAHLLLGSLVNNN